MTWLEGTSRNPTPAGEQLREKLARPEILRVPGAHNAMAGLLARDAGFEAIYISGGGVTTTLGLPDLGIMSLEELCFIVRQVARATDLPLIFDSGIEGGLDILRARALGADLVMLGRAPHYALAALGDKGPAHLIEMLKLDLQSNMGQIGARSLDDLPPPVALAPLP